MTDDERREVAERLRDYVDLPDDWWQETRAEFYVEKCVFGDVNRHREGDLFARLADLIEPPYPDATASYKGWRVQVYDPDGELVSPSNAAADLVRAHADGKMRHSTKEEQNAYSAILEKMSVELHPVDRDALLELADEMDAHWLGHEGMEDSPVARWSRELREALGEAE